MPNKKLNILYLGDKFTIGGGANMMRSLAENFESDKFNIYFCYLRIVKNIKGLKKKKKENVFYLKDSKYGLSSLISLIKIIKKYNFKIIHANGDKSSYFLPIIKILFPDIICIHHEHHSIVSKNWIYSLYLRLTKNFFNFFVAVSKSVKKSLVKKSNIKYSKIQILYNFVDLEKFKPSKRYLNIDNFPVKKKDFVIGFAARLKEFKGWKTFIKTASMLDDKNNYKFLIAGDGEDKRKILKTIEAYKLDKNTKILNFVLDMPSFYNTLDLFIIPSRRETFGLTAIEAQACGIPVIASNISGLNEIINNKINGILFEPKNNIDLLNSIIKLQENKNLREKIIKNGLQSSKKYSLQSYTDRLTKLYSNLINEKK